MEIRYIAQSAKVIYCGSARGIVFQNDPSIIAVMIGLLRHPVPHTDTFIWFQPEIGAGAQVNAIIAILIGLLRDTKPAAIELGFSGG